MRKMLWAVACGVLGTIGIGVLAASKPPDEYVKAMKDLGTVAATIDKATETEDYDAIAKFSDTIKASLGVAQEYWKNGPDDTRETLEVAIKAAADLGVAASLKSQEGVAFAAKAIKASCTGCHAKHREKAADGSFLIK